jgi:hypothetical protein
MRTFVILTISTFLGCASGTVAPASAGHPASPSTSEGVVAAAETAEVHAGHAVVESASEPLSATGYTCPMHPDVTSEKPGQCPKCGMNLVPNKKDAP